VTTDEELMLDVRRGDREAFERLFDRYRDPMWRFFRRRVADPARAEELAQDAFVAVLQGAAQYEPRAPFRSYLFGIAYNLLLAERRKSSRQIVEPLDVDPVAAGEGDLEAAMSVRGALALLDADDREMLMLREYEEFSYNEIAHLKKMPLNTVRSRLFRARMALKAVFERPVCATANVAAVKAGPVKVKPVKVNDDSR
jgi:RNA polymerase sigma-70 factor (ECF subfamily)